VTFTVQKIGKILYFSILESSLFLTFLYSIHCAKKSTAEEYPKNFALLKLAEKTLAKAKQTQ
jgi:hypothetical protein